jgi:hypothetical protein
MNFKSKTLQAIKAFFTNEDEQVTIDELTFKSLKAIDKDGKEVQLMVNDKSISILDAEGTETPAPVGEYTVENIIYVVTEPGIIAEEKTVEPVATAETPAPTTETVKPTDEPTPDLAAELEALKSIVKALVDKIGLDIKDVKMEKTEVDETPENKIEAELKAELEKLKKEVIELSKQPASKGIEFKKIDDTKATKTGNNILDKLISLKNK